MWIFCKLKVFFFFLMVRVSSTSQEKWLIMIDDKAELGMIMINKMS